MNIFEYKVKNTIIDSNEDFQSILKNNNFNIKELIKQITAF